jgi:hypothetical protein
MEPNPRSVLPPSLAVKLTTLGAQLARGQSDRELSDVLSELAVLPADLVVRANREISDAARLGWWKPVPHYLLRMRKLLTEQELLAQNPDYAWLFLFHGNGYVREAALDAINDPPASPFFFAALAWRLNDWVPQVRDAAAECAQRVLPRISADIAANAALYLLVRRLAWRRWNDEAAVLDLVFGRTDVITAMAKRLQQQSTGSLATLMRNALRYPDIDEHLPHLAANAVQPSVRAIAYQCLIAGKASWQTGFETVWIDKVYGLYRSIPKLGSRETKVAGPAGDWIRAAAYDRSSIVRKVAADALIADRARSLDAAALIARLAKDRHSAIRSRADFMLRNPPPTPSS